LRRLLSLVKILALLAFARLFVSFLSFKLLRATVIVTHVFFCRQVVTFQQPNYLANFVQSIFDSLPTNELTGSTLLVSGDGRFYNRDAANLIVRMSAANGVAKVLCARNFLLATPAASASIRARKAYGGIVLTASHNPGGPNADFGVKYNISNGGPAPESVTNRIFANTKAITQYKVAENLPEIDASEVGITHYTSADGSLFTVEVFDSSADYVPLLKSIFDFPALRAFLAQPDFKFTFDGMNGVAGAHARTIFVDELGVSADALRNCVPSEDFGGCHPDPNLTYAEELVARMGLNAEHVPSDIPDFGAAADGDADRNMILGRRFFVTPSDSVAVIAANAQQAIPYFAAGVRGVARSMPTSQALDRVATALSIPLFEVPTGWKFFGNLMDAGRLSICGEESFGTGADHIREKDGCWAVLAWLSILCHHNKNRAAGAPLVSVADIVQQHWRRFGRNYYSRYDYENVDSAAGAQFMANLGSVIDAFNAGSSVIPADSTFKAPLAIADQFCYTDPVDGSVSKNQGVRLIFQDGSRIIYRLSGTGSVGATIRVYIERYVNDETQLNLDTQAALKDLSSLALSISRLGEITGRDAPTVIT
jgi:phosphoglucomutase